MNSILSGLPSLTVSQMIQVDRLMIEEWGISLIQMMENAGRNFAEQARLQLGGTVQKKKVVVLCGNGNNGGGGMAAARHLSNWGADVNVILPGNETQLKETPAHQYRILKRMGLLRDTVDLSKTNLILDAMLGYGATGDPRPPIADWILRANNSGRPVLSLDSPSGLDLTTGFPASPSIRAAATLTLALPKHGLLLTHAKPFVGELYLADIGVPPGLYASMGIFVPLLFTEKEIIRLNS